MERLVWRRRGSRRRKQPSLIILVPWMSASSAHIAKYVRGYQALYPSSQILLVRNTLKHLLWQPHKITPDVRPAVSVVRAAVNPNDPSTQVLIHAWSNGGSAMLSHLRSAFGDTFPSHVLILDSGPGLYSYTRCTAAVTAGMPTWMKILTYPFVSLLTILWWVWYIGRTDGFSWFANSHNEARNEVRRTYIYSESDRLIDWKDVEGHAGKAEEKGYTVRKEKFSGTQHVAHARGDEDRYWDVVRGTWSG